MELDTQTGPLDEAIRGLLAQGPKTAVDIAAELQCTEVAVVQTALQRLGAIVTNEPPRVNASGKRIYSARHARISLWDLPKPTVQPVLTVVPDPELPPKRQRNPRGCGTTTSSASAKTVAKVFDVLRKHREPMTRQELADALGKSHQHISTCIFELRDSIEQTGCRDGSYLYQLRPEVRKADRKKRALAAAARRAQAELAPQLDLIPAVEPPPEREPEPVPPPEPVPVTSARVDTQASLPVNDQPNLAHLLDALVELVGHEFALEAEQTTICQKLETVRQQIAALKAAIAGGQK